MRNRRIVMATLAIVLVVGAAGVLTGFRRQAVADTTGGIDPAAFTNPVANPYFPLKVGTVLHYQGSDGGQRFQERLTITHWTKKIQGVKTTVVLDVLRRADDNTVAEKTWDWYADDNAGNAWYFGEKTATYTRTGRVISRDGSWQAGVHGAVAGTIMPANPHPTDAYRQEFYAGEAEDLALVRHIEPSHKVPAGSYENVLVTEEWTPLEPDVIELKYYAKGIGVVEERQIFGGTELVKLTKVTPAP